MELAYPRLMCFISIKPIKLNIKTRTIIAYVLPGRNLKGPPSQPFPAFCTMPIITLIFGKFILGLFYLENGSFLKNALTLKFRAKADPN
jgi:hypothetical protein